MKQKFAFSLVALIFIALSCSKDEDPIVETLPVVEDEPTMIEINNLSGFVQKGPFINGTEITLLELTENMLQTGRTFNTQITDNMGSYTFSTLFLYSNLVELKANGFYFNEVSGEKSVSLITLYAITDLTERSGLNVNILSHLERERIKYLISQEIEFEDAKKQAQKEILAIFNINKAEMPESETLDISKEGDENAILLAISSILQGFRTEAALAELLANIITDIKEDGTLDDQQLGSELINYAFYLRPEIIRENLRQRYEALGIEANIPDFESYLVQFLDSTDFIMTQIVEYPATATYGSNILSEKITTVTKDKFYSFAADLSAGMHLKIVISGGLWYYEAYPNGPTNWNITTYSEESQEFTSIEDNSKCDLRMQFTIPPYDADGKRNTATSDTVKIEYFENYSPTPVKTKMLIIQ